MRRRVIAPPRLSLEDADAFVKEIDAHPLFDLAPRDLALLSQIVENRIVGASCGVMDQMTAACGVEGELLALLCQPADLREAVSLPAGLELFGSIRECAIRFPDPTTPACAWARSWERESWRIGRGGPWRMGPRIGADPLPSCRGVGISPMSRRPSSRAMRLACCLRS